jgi:hypothetical protein
MQAELVNRIVTGVSKGGPDDYLWTEALRAAAVNPGAHVQFGAAVQNPALGQGYKTAAQAYADKSAQETTALKQANNALSVPQDLMNQRSRLGATVMGGYAGSPQQSVDRQLMDSYINASPDSAVQQLGRSVSGNRGSGWLPSLPIY